LVHSATGFKKWTIDMKHMKTSIGNSAHSRPKNKKKRRGWKRYRGQGKAK